MPGGASVGAEDDGASSLDFSAISGDGGLLRAGDTEGFRIVD